MAMSPCRQCRSNKWSYEVKDAEAKIKATCGKCGNSVEWTSDKLKRRASRVYAEFVPHFSREEIENQTGEPPW